MGVPVTGNISTTSPLDTYPTHLAQLGKGGAVSAANLAAVYLIPVDRREFGMVVTCQSDGKMVQLCTAAMGGTNSNLADNSNWVALFCKARFAFGSVSFTNEKYKEVNIDDPLASLTDLPTLIFDGNANTQYIVEHGVQFVYKTTNPGAGYVISCGAPNLITANFSPIMTILY
jgi:hypothetical protein